MKQKELIVAAKELNQVLELDPKIKTVAIKNDALEKEVVRAGDLLEDGDVISKELNSILETLKVEIPEGVEVEGAKESDKDDDSNEVFTAYVELAVEMNKVMDLDPAIDTEADIETLKEEIVNNCFDDDEVCEIYTTDDFSKESLKTLKELGVVPFETHGEPVEKEKKESAADKKKRLATEKKEKAGSKKDKPPKKEKKGPKSAGVIATIIAQIKENGPISKEDILKAMVKAFPDREEKAMKNTINVQIPNRINKERDFTVASDEDGKWSVE